MKRKKDYRKVSSKHSAMVVERKASARDLAAALAAQGDTAADGLMEELECVLEEGEEMPDLRFVFELLERRVRRAGEDLDRADEERFLEEMRMSVARYEAQGARDELYAETVRVRKALVECFGSKRARFQFGLSERTPRGMTDLSFEARRIVDRLDRPDLELPELRLPALTADPEGWSGGLRPSLERLETLLLEIAERRMAVVDGIAGCRKALESFDATYLHVARAAEALFVLAGCPELARRLRPSERRERSPKAVPQLAELPELLLDEIVKRTAAAAAGFRQWLGGVLGWTAWGGAVAAWRARREHLLTGKAPKTGVPALAGRIPRAGIA